MSTQKTPNLKVPKKEGAVNKPAKKKPRDYRIEITPEQVREIEAMGALGMSTIQIIDAMGWKESTFYYWTHTRPELGLIEAIKRGKAKGVKLVTQKLMAKINNMDTASIIFYLKTQAGWRENIGLVGGDGGPVQVEHSFTDLSKLSDKELESLERIIEKATTET